MKDKRNIEKFDDVAGHWLHVAMTSTNEEELSKAQAKLDYARACASFFAHLEALKVTP